MTHIYAYAIMHTQRASQYDRLLRSRRKRDIQRAGLLEKERSLNPYIRKIKQLAKLMISYHIEGEEKIYRIKHTPFQVKRRYTRFYHRELEPLPVQPEKVIFDNYMGRGYGCNGKYVTEALLEKTKELDLVWVVKDAERQKDLFPKEVRLVEYGTPEAMYEYATAGVWAQNYQMVRYLNRGLLKKSGQVYIQMWHGSFGIKKIENDCRNLTQDQNWTLLARRNSAYTDYWISNSVFESDIYRQAFWDVEKILEYGHPRNDIFFGQREKKARDAVEAYIGRKDCRLLLYVPTFRDDWSVPGERLDLERMKQNLELRFGGCWQILLRLHPRAAKEGEGPEFFGKGGISVTDYPDIQELLAAADAVVTDYSSAVFDFLLTGRPAFIYAPDYEKYQKLRGLYYPLEETPFPLAIDNGQLSDCILEFDEASYRRNAEVFLKEKGSAEDGHAAERVADLILACIAQNRKNKGEE